MAGYDGYSMSNNAVSAYESGEKPMSKWTKEEFIWECAKNDIHIKSIKSVKPFLKWSSWHHTSKMYNRTDFYNVNFELLNSAIESGSSAVVLQSEEWVAERNRARAERLRAREERRLAKIESEDPVRGAAERLKSQMKEQLLTCRVDKYMAANGRMEWAIYVTQAHDLLYGAEITRGLLIYAFEYIPDTVIFIKED